MLVTLRESRVTGSFITYILVTLIVCLVFIVIDLDRPRRGLIQVNQQSILDLQPEMALHK